MPTDKQLAKLPAWARQHIKELEEQANPNNAELARLRRETLHLQAHIARLQTRIDAMVEMFKCAAKGENEIAKAVERIIQDWIAPEGKEGEF